MELAGFEHFSILGGFGTYEVQIALFYALAHFVLRFALKPIWGDKRNSVAVMGGSDGARGDAKFSAKDLAKRSLTIDVVAYNMIAVSYAVYCAVTGPMGWLDGSAAKVEGSPTDRLYAESSGAMALASLTASYELYNTVTVIFLPEYATAAFIGHHACTCLLAILGMHPFLNYYGFFFFGLSAVSSVPLALTELLKVMNSTAGLELCEIVFAILFLCIRTVYWPYVSYGFWGDMLGALQGTPGYPPVHSTFAYVVFLVANVGLTSLQLFWTTKILSAIVEKLGGGGEPPKKKKK